MSKLKVSKEETLTLKQVIAVAHKGIPFEAIDKLTYDFENRVKVYGAQTYGPLITRMSGTNVNALGEISTDFTLMIQAHDYEFHKDQFEVYESLTIEHCLYVRFDDHPQYLQYATAAIELYMYENEILDTGILYTVIVDGSETNVTIDYFKPVSQ